MMSELLLILWMLTAFCPMAAWAAGAAAAAACCCGNFCGGICTTAITKSVFITVGGVVDSLCSACDEVFPGTWVVGSPDSECYWSSGYGDLSVFYPGYGFGGGLVLACPGESPTPFFWTLQLSENAGNVEARVSIDFPATIHHGAGGCVWTATIGASPFDCGSLTSISFGPGVPYGTTICDFSGATISVAFS